MELADKPTAGMYVVIVKS